MTNSNKISDHPQYATFLEDYKVFRTRLEHEDNLVNHRMTWLLLSQIILLVTFMNMDEAQQLSNLGLTVKLVGFTVTFLSFFGVILAIISILTLRKKFRNRWDGILSESFLELHSIRSFYWVGNLSALSIPLTFVIVWLVWLLR